MNRIWCEKCRWTFQVKFTGLLPEHYWDIPKPFEHELTGWFEDAK